MVFSSHVFIFYFLPLALAVYYAAPKALRMPPALKHKKVVVWAFSARDLYDEAVVWEKVPLPERQP